MISKPILDANKIINVPELELSNISDVRLFAKIDPSEGYGSNYWPDLNNGWAPMSYMMTNGKVYYRFKNVAIYCDESTESSYYTDGNYKLLLQK